MSCPRFVLNHLKKKRIAKPLWKQSCRLIIMTGLFSQVLMVFVISSMHFINCTKMLAAAGVRALRYHLDYRNDPIVLELLRDAGLDLRQL